MHSSLPRAEVARLFAEKVQTSLREGTFVRLVISSPKPGLAGPERVLGRCVQLQGQLHLTLTLQFSKRDETKNIKLEDAGEWVRTQVEEGFGSGLLGTTRHDWQFSAAPGKRVRLVRHAAACREAPSRSHDQPRQRLLDRSASAWLCPLGVTDPMGRVRPGLADKYAQINRYLEIFSHLAEESRWKEEHAPVGERRCLTIADMGCGKGYLTFALWHLLHRVWGWPVKLIGVEVRPDLVAANNSLAEQIEAKGLEFVCGTIQTVPVPALHALIALHACDTASDDAISRGVKAGAELILIAPCCHKQLRINLHAPATLAPVMRFGIMEERMAEWLSDGLRALYLEAAGYQTKIMEFVSSEHTAKNLMIAAIKTPGAASQPQACRRIAELKEMFGIKSHPLDALLEPR